MHVPQAASQTVVRREASTALSSTGAEAATPSPALASARAIARLRYVVVVALLVPTVLFAAVAWYLHQQAFNDARHQLDAVVSIAKEHALKVFDTNEMLLQRMLKRRYPALPVIPMSGYANRLDEAVEENFVAMPKPCALDTLAETIEMTLKHRARSDGQGASVDP